MTPAISAVAATTPALLTPPPVNQTLSSPQDVARLQALIANVQPTGEVMSPTVTPPTEAIEAGGFVNLGDSILQGVAKFNAGYNEGLDTINTKLQAVSDPTQLGNNFGEIMALQVEVARWSMSVMGVDNASKAGTNTIKELSKGG